MNAILLRPRLAIAIYVVVLLFPGPLLLNLTVDNAPESYFPTDAPSVRFDNRVRELFPQDQVLVALFKGNNIFDGEFLTELEKLSSFLESHELIERVISVSSVDHIQPTPDGFAVEKLLGGGNIKTDAKINRARALADTFAPGILVSPEGDALALIVRPEPMKGSLQRLELYQHVQRTIQASDRIAPQLHALGGHIALDVAQLKAMIRDLATLIPGTLAISMLLLWWLFRKWLILAVSAASISAVTGIGLAVLALLGHPFTLITAILPPLLTALTVAMLVHLFNALSHFAARGLTGEARVRSAVKTVGTPILFTALTTASGLLSLMASPIRPIASFGLVSAVAVTAGAVLIVSVLPAIVLYFDEGRPRTRPRSLKLLDRFTSACLRLALRRTGMVLALGTALLALCIAQIPKIEVETDLYHFFGDTHPINVATRDIESSLSGVMPLEVVFAAESMDDLKDPARLQAIADVENWLNSQPGVDYTTGLPDLIAEMHWAFDPARTDARPLPQDAALIEQYLLFYDGADLYDLDPEFTTARILANLSAHGTSDLNKLLSDLRVYMERHPPADMQWDTAGMGRLFADQERLLIQGQVNSLFLVACMITALMFLLWKRVDYTLVSIIPNLAPVVVIFGLMGTLGIWLDMATAMVASVAIGIAIDDTIHLLHGIKTGRDSGIGATTVIARTVRHRGRALVGTTIVLCAQFLLMTASSFVPTATFGALTALGLVFALVFDLLVLPALVAVVESRRP